jgi:predicted transposase/invertase (TIGR01784 family)
LQTDNDVLKAIICAYLDMNPEEIKTARITNAITLKDVSVSKEMILDIRAEMNDDSIINLEMQVQNNHDWPERSISYLCRCFDNLQKGQGYTHVKGAVHIGFLDYTLFPEYPEFYATYRLRNERTGQLYSGKFRISVVDLTQIKLATEEDKQSHRSLWAAFFKATSWEDLKMLAQQDKNMEQAVVTVQKLSEDELFRLRYEAREDFLRQQIDHDTWYENEFAKQKKTIAEQGQTITEQGQTIAELGQTITELQSTIEALRQQIANLQNTK